ncbi:CASP8 and FADD-like apoptosis regulator isoform X2 [Ranitomeya variabilis]|uniref:CASP8 and FADD-like apoptosis regulator isoform X2 n=1 Tax=Ranitomeya variabilis TaxID=490064 RepID=UPI004056F224
MVTRNEVFCQTNCLLNCAATAERNIVMSRYSVTSRTLIQIVEELESEEEEVIKFACQDLTSNTNIRELLSELNDRNSHPVILELLYLLKRFDLIKKYYNMTKVEVNMLLIRQSRIISDYRYLMIELNEEVEEHELDALIFLQKNYLRNGGKLKNKTFLSLIVELEKNQLVMPSYLDRLESMFQTIHRVDLKNRIRKFQQKDNGVCVGGPYVNALPVSASFLRKNRPANSQLAASSIKDATPVQETMLQAETCQSRGAGRGEASGDQPLTSHPRCTVPEQLFKSADHEESYPVRKHHRGFCVIIDCVGNDAEMLEAVFRSQYFTVKCHMYKKVDEVEAILQDVAHMEQHRQHDVFVCIIISRGNADSLFCLDGDLPGLSLDRIKSFFTGQSCPNLRGKPKLFFLQNYLISDTEEEGCVEVDGPQECAARRPQIQNHSRIPNEADIFWSHCRVKELELQRSSGSPSLYLRSLRDLLAEKKASKDILDIHTELNRIIYAKKSGYSLQLRHTLTKKLYLHED